MLNWRCPLLYAYPYREYTKNRLQWTDYGLQADLLSILVKDPAVAVNYPSCLFGAWYRCTKTNSPAVAKLNSLTNERSYLTAVDNQHTAPAGIKDCLWTLSRIVQRYGSLIA